MKLWWQRSLDEPEIKYIEKCGIIQISVEDVTGNIYVHIDLDVLDVKEDKI